MSSEPTAEEINAYLTEDLGSGDVTAALIPAAALANARVISRESAVLCGRAWFEAIFHRLDPAITIDWRVEEGLQVEKDTILCQLHGSARALLSGERTALNLLQTLSATATVSRRYADAVAGTGCKVLDTRKTLPGLRRAQKYAVSCGGCHNHRIGLYDAVLIKENHIIAAGSVEQAINSARAMTDLMVEVEVENMTEFGQALAVRPDRIMLDNFSLEDMQAAVAINGGKVELEASGNIDLSNIREIALTGVDYISIGALTKNIQAIDLSMRINLVQKS